MLRRAGVDDKEHLPSDNLLAFAHAYLRKLTVHLRGDGHVGLSAHLGAELDGHCDVLFLHRQGLKG